MAQLLLRLSCCASSKEIKPDLQWSIESLSFDFSEPAQTTPTGKGINTSRKLFQKKHYEIMTQLLFRLSCCASLKKINPDLQWSNESFSFDYPTPAQTTLTGEGVNASRILSQKQNGAGH